MKKQQHPQSKFKFLFYCTFVYLWL